MKVPANFHLLSLLWLCDSGESATFSSVTHLRRPSMEVDRTLPAEVTHKHEAHDTHSTPTRHPLCVLHSCFSGLFPHFCTFLADS